MLGIGFCFSPRVALKLLTSSISTHKHDTRGCTSTFNARDSAGQYTVRVKPADLGRQPLNFVTSVIEEIYLDHVLKDIGLVVCLNDVKSIEGGMIYPSDGAAHFDVKFSLVVFRPLIGELLVGELKCSSKDGIWVSLSFFEDVFVPKYHLQQPSEYDSNENVWVWKWEGNMMYMDEGSKVRLRVKDVLYRSIPTGKELKSTDGSLGTASNPFRPMEVIGVMDADGLGCIDWWLPPEDDN